MSSEKEEGAIPSLRYGRARSPGWAVRMWIPRLAAALFVVTGILSMHFIADVLPMILAGAVDLRHFAWVALGSSASFLAFVLAWRAYQLRRPLAERVQPSAGSLD